MDFSKVKKAYKKLQRFILRGFKQPNSQKKRVLKKPLRRWVKVPRPIVPSRYLLHRQQPKI